MLTLYWMCFAVGGTFVLLAVFSGFDGVDFGDSTFDVHLDDDVEVAEPREPSPDSPFSHHQSTGSALFSIVKTLRFWTFTLCFFGLTGLVLSHLSTPLSPVLIAIAAVIMGILCGGLVAGGLRLLGRRQTDSLVRSDDLVGATGIVEIPFDKDSRGKVRLLVKGSQIDMLASTDETKLLQRGDRVLVVGLEQNRLWVVAAQEGIGRED